MLKLYPLKKIFLFSFLLIQSYKICNAQILTVGNIAFTGYNSTGNAPQLEVISFVLLVNIPAGTVINFTDNGWLSTNAFRTGEQTVTWTAGSALVAGREIRISGPSDGVTTATAIVSGSNINPGTCTGSMLSLSVNGDQVIAYQGSAAAPTIISGIHMNVYSTAGGDLVNTTDAVWDGDATNNNSSAKPSALTSGTNAVWVGNAIIGGERNNARFNCTGPLATPAQVRAAVNNKANWDAEFGASGAIPTWIPPSGCAFLASIFPVQLVSFTATNNGSNIGIQWKTENENHFSHYELERSIDGINFTKIATIQSRGGVLPNNYDYTDADAVRISNGTVYYRLKLVDVTGIGEYSTIAKVKTFDRANFLVDQLPVPFKGSLSFSIISKKTGKVGILILDANGSVLSRQSITLQTGSNRVTLPQTNNLTSGIYMMEITNTENDRKTIKLVKD